MDTKKKVKFVTLNVTEETKAKVTHMAKILGPIKISALVEAIIDDIYDAVSEFSKAFMVSDVRGNKAQFIFVGKSNLISGHFSGSTTESDESVDKRVKSEVDKEIQKRNEE